MSAKQRLKRFSSMNLSFCCMIINTAMARKDITLTVKPMKVVSSI
jgi:hypothetical protein